MQPLNRAARRRKSKPQKHLNKAALWGTASTRILKHSLDDTPETALHDIMLPQLAALEKIKAGLMDEDCFRKFWEMFEFGTLLCSRLQGFSRNESTAKLLDQVRDGIQAAYGLLYPLTERMEIEGRYRVQGTELETLQEAVRLVGELLQVSSQGHTLTGLMQAAENLENGVDFLTRLSIRRVEESSAPRGDSAAMQQASRQVGVEVTCGA